MRWVDGLSLGLFLWHEGNWLKLSSNAIMLLCGISQIDARSLLTWAWLMVGEYQEMPRMGLEH